MKRSRKFRWAYIQILIFDHTNSRERITLLGFLSTEAETANAYGESEFGGKKEEKKRYFYSPVYSEGTTKLETATIQWANRLLTIPKWISRLLWCVTAVYNSVCWMIFECVASSARKVLYRKANDKHIGIEMWGEGRRSVSRETSVAVYKDGRVWRKAIQSPPECILQFLHFIFFFWLLHVLDLKCNAA